jgi:hypothetical protein
MRCSCGLSEVVRVRREHQARGRRLDRATYVTTDRHAVAIRQANIEDGDVRAQCGNARERLGGCPGVADDLDTVLALQELGDASPDDLMVVEQEHRDGHTGDGIGADSGLPRRSGPGPARTFDPRSRAISPRGRGRWGSPCSAHRRPETAPSAWRACCSKTRAARGRGRRRGGLPQASSLIGEVPGWHLCRRRPRPRPTVRSPATIGKSTV